MIVEDTYAEAFEGYYSRILVTAINEKWVRHAAAAATGYATSMIGCSAEAGIERYISTGETPDNRPGAVLQIWAGKKKMMKELLGRIGQCILPAPTTAVWNFCPGGELLDVGYKMRYYADGFEEIREVAGRRMVVIPVMMGEFLIEAELGVAKGVMGGNFFILASSQDSALEAAEKALEAIQKVEGVIAPFPGGVCGSGSKVGSKKYKFMHATTNERYCPTLSEGVKDSMVNNLGAVAEIVINGVSEEKVREAMAAGIKAVLPCEGVEKVSAGNYGGGLGKIHIHLRELL
jgi:formylmethanofuran--tetrahydromethanopterin N-formyltransferase